MMESNSNDLLVVSLSNTFFISSLENPNFVPITSVLNGIGFNSWKQCMMISLSVKNKLGFSVGTMHKHVLTSPSYPT